MSVVRNLFLIKRNKRLMIVDGAGVCVYTPPDFLLPLRSREGMRVLAERMAVAQDPFDEIMAFEARAMKKRSVGARTHA